MKLIATIAVMLIASAAHAQWTGKEWTPATEGRTSAEYKACEARAERADTYSFGYVEDLIKCLDCELPHQDARLNQAYKMVMMRLSPTRRTELRNLQRTWIAKRDRDCRAADDGGQAGYLGARTCLVGRTITRTTWLERYR